MQRQAQTGALALPQVGMVVAADRGDSAGAFHPIHPPTKEELSHRAFLVTDRLLYGNTSSPLQGPQVVSATFDAWDDSWGDFHYGTGTGSYVCKPGTPFTCGGVRVTFDQPLELSSTFADKYSYANGLELLASRAAGAKQQRAQITGVRAEDAHTLQLNTTWVWGEAPPTVLQYAFSDYPSMFIYNAFGLPAPPFTVDIKGA